MIRNRVLVIGVAIVATSCSRGVSPVQTRPLLQSNPTSYSFPRPLAEVRAAAFQAYSLDHQAGQPIFGKSKSAVQLETMLFIECATNAVFGEAVFRDPANTNDFYLHSMHSPFVLSSVYHGRNGGLPYIAAFHLHLTTDGSNTLVSATALDTEVINGMKFGFGSCGPGYGWNCEPVKPTTVEEYSVLRYLGQYMGLTNMPDVVMPKP